MSKQYRIMTLTCWVRQFRAMRHNVRNSIFKVGNKNISQSVSSVPQLCPTLCDPKNCSMPGLPVHHQLLEFTQTHVHWVGDATQPSHPLLFPSPPALKSFPASGSFQMSRIFASDGQSIGIKTILQLKNDKAESINFDSVIISNKLTTMAKD